MIITPQQTRDSSMCPANRMEIYTLHNIVKKCYVFNTKWTIELYINNNTYEGFGRTRKIAVEMAEDKWRNNESREHQTTIRYSSGSDQRTRI